MEVSDIKLLLIIAAACILSFLVGIIVEKFLNKPKIDGRLLIGTVEDRDQFQFIFTTELEDLQNQKVLTMQIVKAQNLQSQ